MILPIDVILVPQGAEYQAVCRGINRIKPPHPQVIPIPLGINAAIAYLNQKSEDFSSLISKNIVLMGLGGSLSSHYQVGDVLIYNSCLLPHNNQESSFSRLECNRALTNILDAKLKPNVSLVDGLTSTKVISNYLEKQKLAQIYSVQVVDMEGYGVLSSFKNTSSAITIIRIISDDSHHSIPDLSLAISADGKLNPLILAWQMFKQPIAAFRLIRGSLIALNVLENTVVKLLS